MGFQERLIGAGVFGTAAGGTAAAAIIKSYGEVPAVVVGAVVAGAAVLFATMAVVEGGYRLVDGYLCKRRASKHNQELKANYPEYVQ